MWAPQNRVVTLKLVRYSMWMVLAPLGTFYFLYYVIFKQNKEYLGWCGIAAVIAANIVIGLYVHMAWHEDDGEEKRTIKVD
jgi:cytochrome c oxidase subunit IV